jgi:hypothetical protein
MCPEALPLRVDDRVEGRVTSDESPCYRVYVEAPDTYTFDVDTDDGEADLALALYDRGGDQISYNDDDPRSYDPRLSTYLDQPGIYFLVVEGLNRDDTGPYALRMIAGMTEPAFRDARPITPGERIESAITPADELVIELFDYEGYGHVYSFRGNAGDRVTIDVIADSLGSEVDPYAVLFDSSLESVADDSDSGEDYDARIDTTLQKSDMYYIVVINENEEFGDREQYFYFIELEIQ